jgi:nucleotide-binding universal stress UspA family protein
VAEYQERQQPRPAPPRLELAEGAAVEVIRNAVERLRPDLLALGTNSRNGLSEALLGSTTRELLVAGTMRHPRRACVREGVGSQTRCKRCRR